MNPEKLLEHALRVRAAVVEHDPTDEDIRRAAAERKALLARLAAPEEASA